MRISTNTLFEIGASRLGELQTSLGKTQEQISTGRRVLTPADDPVAAAQALELSQARAMNSQLAVNRQGARHSLNMQEQALQSVTGLVQDVQTLVVSAGNGALDSSQRQFMATELRGRLEDLLGLANTTDGSGNFLFAGYQNTTQPFSRTATGAQYNSDQGQRTLQVGLQRTLALSEPGSAVFENIRTGNGTFAASAASANTGSGVVTLGANTSGVPPATTYEVRFTSATAYDVVDTGVVPEVPVSAGNAYVSGEAITIAGMQIQINGVPAGGDAFVLEPSSNQSVFTTMTDLINLLATPSSGAAGQAALTNGLSIAGQSMSNALDSILTTRASVGSRLRELDSLDTQGEDRDVQYATTLAELQELDYTKAITDLTKQKIILEAAQQSFVKTAGLSLFNYI